MNPVLGFLVTLSIVVLVHEWGHYRMAKACGVKVLRFSLGFGKVLLRYQRSPDSTEFVLSALPLGGYVRMLDQRSGVPVPPAEAHLALERQPLRSRALIVAAGPIANLVLAMLLYAMAGWVGTEEPKAVLGAPTAGSLAEKAGLRAGDWVQAADDGEGARELRSFSDLRWAMIDAMVDRRDLTLDVTDAQGHHARSVRLPLAELGSEDVDAQLMQKVGIGAPYGEPVMGEIVPASPAAQAGLREGDRVLAVDGEPVRDAARLRERIRGAVQDGQPRAMDWQVERGGRTLQLRVQPKVEEVDGRTIGRIGAFVGRPPEMVQVSYGVLDGIAYGVTRTWEVSMLSLRMLGKMLIGQASVKNLSGPLSIADYAGQSSSLGLAYYLGFLAMVSVSLGVVNLLPLPVLDGGHLMYYLFEGVTGRPISDVWLDRLQFVGLAIIVLMTSIALYNDVARLLGQH